jgi:hypothetical protein
MAGFFLRGRMAASKPGCLSSQAHYEGNMARSATERYAPPVQAKIIKHGQDRYVVMRYPRTPSAGYSYHYFLMEPGDKLKKQVTRLVIRKIVGLPHASENELAKFYDRVWSGTPNTERVR